MHLDAPAQPLVASGAADREPDCSRVVGLTLIFSHPEPSAGLVPSIVAYGTGETRTWTACLNVSGQRLGVSVS